MQYHKQIFNLTPDNADKLADLTVKTGLSMSQMVNDSLAHVFGTSSPMINARLDLVRSAVRSTAPGTYPPIPPSGVIANDATRKRPAPRK